jgi:large subunit ribosomal protein L11
MGKVSVKLLVDGGKASAGPPLGPSLAPLKVNIGQVVSAINEKTKEFSGMQVPVEVVVDTSTKEFNIKVGTPPVSSLIKKELKLEKLAKTAWKEPAVGNLNFDQVLKITKAKLDVLGTRDFKKAVKQVVAACVSLGVSVEGKTPKEILKEINEGKFDSKIK